MLAGERKGMALGAVEGGVGAWPGEAAGGRAAAGAWPCDWQLQITTVSPGPQFADSTPRTGKNRGCHITDAGGGRRASHSDSSLFLCSWYSWLINSFVNGESCDFLFL